MAQSPGPARASSLKKKAEARLRVKPKPARNKWPKDAAKLVHELEVHQVELEMQNEELRRAQAEIEKSRSRYADLYDFAPVAYLTFDRNGVIREANLKAAELLGKTRRALIGALLFPFLADHSRNNFRESCREAIQSPGKHACEFRLARRDGTDVWVLAESVGMEDEEGKVSLIRSLFWDITERKRQESEIRRLNAELENKVQVRTNALQVAAGELRARKSELETQISELRWTQGRLAGSEERFRVALKDSPIMVFNQDQDLRYTWVFNLPPQMKDRVVLGKTDAELFSAEEAARLTEIKRRVLETGKRTREEVSVSLNGALRYLDLTGEPHFGAAGETIGITCAAMDVSDRKLREEEKALAERNRLLEAFFTSTITPLVFLDRDFNFIRVNKAYAETCRRDASEFPGRNHFEIYPDKENEEIFRRVVGTKIPFQAFAKAFCCPDDPAWRETFWDWTLTPILNPGGEVRYLVLSLNNVTEQARAQDKIRQSEELLRTVLELLPVGVWIFDREGKIIRGNQAGRVIWGGTRYMDIDQYGELKGWRLDSGNPIGPGEWAAARAIRKGESSLNEEIEIESFDGTRKIVLASTVPLRNGGEEIGGGRSRSLKISPVGNRGKPSCAIGRRWRPWARWQGGSPTN